jgi:O-antigen ligase
MLNLINKKIESIKFSVFSCVPFPYLYKMAFFILLPMTVFAPQGITVLTLILAVIFFLDMYTSFSLKYIFQKNNKLLLLISIFLIFSFFTSFWSIAKEESFKEVLRITILFLAGYSVFRGLQTTSYQTEIIKSLWTGWVVTVILLFIEAITEGIILSVMKFSYVEMHKYNKSTSVMVLFLIPVFLLKKKYLTLEQKESLFLGKKLETAIFILFIVTIFILVSGTSKLALMGGIMLPFALYILPQKVRKGFLQIIVCFYFIGIFIIPNIYAIPTIKQYTFKNVGSTSFYDRISIWTNVRNIVLNKSDSVKGSTRRTFFGFGLGSSKVEVFSKQRCAWEIPLSSLLSDSSKRNRIRPYLGKYLRHKMNIKQNTQPTNTQPTNTQPTNTQPTNTQNNSLALKFGQCNNSGIKAPIYKYPLAITEGLPLHPHNNVLQITLELGFVGIFLFFLMIQLCIQGIWKLNSNPCYLCMLSGTLLSFLIISSISYGIWQSWWVCTLWLVLSVLQRIRS